MSIKDTLHSLQLEMTATKMAARPNMSEWDKSASHWQITLKRVGFGSGKEIATSYSMGSAHKGSPKIEDVVYSLLSDAQCSDGTFEDFCDNLGYDSDSRKALETYLACQEIEKKLRQMFSSDELATLNEAFEGY